MIEPEADLADLDRRVAETQRALTGPHGFTWPMVDAIRGIVRHHQELVPLPDEELGFRADALAAADKIALLLPPRLP